MKPSVLRVGCSVLFVAALLAAAPSADAQVMRRGKSPWLTSWVQATTLAKKQDKLILAYFCGSDWCDWCKKLDREVMTTNLFLDWAKPNVLLVKVDFLAEGRQSPAIKKQNRELKDKYNVTKTPTILFINHEEQMLQRFTYEDACLREDENKGLPRTWVQMCKDLVANPPKPKKMDMTEGFVKGRNVAKRSGLPMLIVLEHNPDPDSAAKLERLLVSPRLQKFADASTVVTHVKWPKAGEVSLDAITFQAWKAKHSIEDKPIQLILYDAKTDRVTDRIPTFRTDNMAPLIRRLSANLPEIEYDGRWLDDIRTAKAIAAQQKRAIIFAFMDDKQYSQKIEQEIFNQEEFTEYAKRYMVLARLDYSASAMAKQTDFLKRQNESAAQTYQIRGYPTLILLNAGAQKIANAGYQKGGPLPLLQQVDEVRKADEKRTDHPSLW